MICKALQPSNTTRRDYPSRRGSAIWPSVSLKSFARTRIGYGFAPDDGELLSAAIRPPCSVPDPASVPSRNCVYASRV